MAHIVKLGQLTDELLLLIAGTSAKSEPAKFTAYRESALRVLRSHAYPRTNQFEIASSLDGLEEKFRVYNEDPLADALRERLDVLDQLDVKLSPEILHLLLELSDKPVTKSKLEDLETLKEPEPDPGPPLKWKDLIAEDPELQDKSLWRNVDFTAASSDEDSDDLSEISEPTNVTAASSVECDVRQRPEDYAVDTIKAEQLQALRLAQFWRKNPAVNGVRLETVKVPITELQSIREVLLMLGGLNTSLFEITSHKPFTIEPSRRFVWSHSSPEAFFNLTKTFAKSGSSVARLRTWVKRVEPIPLIQVLQGSIAERLGNFDRNLSIIESRFLGISEDVVVSILKLQAELHSSIQPLLRLSTIIEKLVSERYGHAFRYLEILYDETCISQMAGDSEMYEFMGKIFFQCFQVYLRPIRSWMEEGELSKGDKVFFVSEAIGDSDLSSLWQSKFKIRKTQDGVLHAPRFLSAAANKIFTAGKSVVMLKLLNQFEVFKKARDAYEPTLDFKSVCNPRLLSLAPFPELFDTAFDEWVQSKHHHASLLLKRTLFESFGLHTSVDALASLYFLGDGIITSAFAGPIFNKLDTLNNSWNDGFLLTELAQSTFGTISAVVPDRLRAHILSLSRRQQDVVTCRRTVKALSIIEIRYNLSWPIQTIVTTSSVSYYKRIFTFLLQIQRSSHILSRERLIKDNLSTSSSSDERALYFSLRAALLWFNRMIYYYLTSIVLEPCSQRVRSDLKNAEDVNAMIDIHNTFVKTITDQALLGSRLELIHKTVVKILDLGIKLEDARAANAVASKEAMEQQQEMMDISMASLGLTPKRRTKQTYSFRQSLSKERQDIDSDSDGEEDQDVDVDLSIMSMLEEDKGDVSYVDKLQKMRADFDRLVRFVATGLKGVARAGGGDAARSWDTLAEMLESGLVNGASRY